MLRSIAFGLKTDLIPFIEGAIDRDAFRIDFVDFKTADLTEFDIVVPVTIRDIEMLRQHHAPQSHKFLIPDRAVTTLCNDKKALNERLVATGFAHLIPPLQDKASRRLPYVLKKRVASSGQETFIIRTAEEDEAQADRLASDGYFCQAYADSPLEYATHMLFVDARPVYHSTNQYWMAPHVVKGNSAKPVKEISGIDMGDGIILELAEVLRSIAFEGLCCFDYKVQAGQIQLLEINPRFGFTLFRDIGPFLDAYISVLTARQTP